MVIVGAWIVVVAEKAVFRWYYLATAVDTRYLMA